MHVLLFLAKAIGFCAAWYFIGLLMVGLGNRLLSLYGPLAKNSSFYYNGIDRTPEYQMAAAGPILILVNLFCLIYALLSLLLGKQLKRISNGADWIIAGFQKRPEFPANPS
ncbi:MAG: hypothetical protein Q7S36_01860 [Candidatus Liptonbacteria bacterium]|nr:hypothetical protein [Candidatus Liptonbacteria bacterium]